MRTRRTSGPGRAPTRSRARATARHQTVRHAHGYGVQTLADLGLVGLGLSLVASVLWIVAAMARRGCAGATAASRSIPSGSGC